MIRLFFISLTTTSLLQMLSFFITYSNYYHWTSVRTETLRRIWSYLFTDTGLIVMESLYGTIDMMVPRYSLRYNKDSGEFRILHDDEEEECNFALLEDLERDHLRIVR